LAVERKFSSRLPSSFAENPPKGSLMKKLLQTKTVLIALFVAVPALAAGTAAAVGGGGGDEPTSVVQPVGMQPAADREDVVTAADDNGDAAVPHHAKPKADTQSDPADTEEQDTEQADEDDQGEDEQADEDDQGENEDVQDDDQGENDDAQADEDGQGDDTSADQGGDD
jgi:hypothetical protein